MTTYLSIHKARDIDNLAGKSYAFTQLPGSGWLLQVRLDRSYRELEVTRAESGVEFAVGVELAEHQLRCDSNAAVNGQSGLTDSTLSKETRFTALNT